MSPRPLYWSLPITSGRLPRSVLGAVALPVEVKLALSPATPVRLVASLRPLYWSLPTTLERLRRSALDLSPLLVEVGLRTGPPYTTSVDSTAGC